MTKGEDEEMIWQIVKKQGLIIMEKSTTITIINWSSDYPNRHFRYGTSSMMDGQDPEIQVKVAIIEHDDEKQQVERFIKDLEKTEIPEEQIRDHSENVVSEMTPITILKDSVFGSEELKDMIEIIDVHEFQKKR